jgi:RNA polymerase sigma factor (sigma-70 family)
MSEIRDENAMYEMARMIARVKSRGRHYREDAISEAYLAVANGAADRSEIENAVRRFVRGEWALEDGYTSLEVADSVMREGAPDRARPDVWGALAVLDERQRAVIGLTFWDGLTQAEIAKGLGISQVMVHLILEDSLRALKVFFDGTYKTTSQNAVAE